jgi:hypothetical protein
MLLQKIVSILTTEIKWSRIVLLALGAAVVALVVSGGAFNLLALTVFSIAGIFIERIAPKHPYLNAFCYGLLGVLFYSALFVFQALGEGQGALTAVDVLVGLALPVAVVVVPQALIGAWLGRSIRKFTQVAAEARKAREADAPKEKAAPTGPQPAPPPQKKTTAKSPAAQQGKKKR